jgi:hypothetical protein
MMFPRLHRLSSFLGCLEWAAFLSVLVWGASLRMDLPAVPVSDGDTWGYLGPALSALNGGPFLDTQQREWLYAAFVAGAARLSGSLSGVATAHHAATFLAALALWMTWRTWLWILPIPRLARFAATAPALFLTAALLGNPDLIAFEFSLRPESVMICTAFLQLWAVTAFCFFRWTNPRAYPAALCGICAILLACMIFKLRPSWAFAVPVTTLPIAVGVFGSALPASVRWGTPLAGVVLAIVLVFLPGKLIYVEELQPRTVLPMTLFTMNADTILKSLEENMDTVPEEQRAAFNGVLPILHEELDAAREFRRFYPSVGHDPDYLMYRARVFPYLAGTHGYDRAALAAFCMETYFGAWKTHPADMLNKVVTQFALFARPDDKTFIRKRIQTAALYRGSVDTVPEHPPGKRSGPGTTMLATYREDLARQADRPGLEIRAPRFLHEPLRDLPGRVWTIQGLFLIALVLAFALHALRPLLPGGLLALLFFATPAANALTVALVHSLDNDRYRASYGPFLLFSLAAMGVFLLIVTISIVAPAAWHFAKRTFFGDHVQIGR